MLLQIGFLTVLYHDGTATVSRNGQSVRASLHGTEMNLFIPNQPDQQLNGAAAASVNVFPRVAAFHTFYIQLIKSSVCRSLFPL